MNFTNRINSWIFLAAFAIICTCGCNRENVIDGEVIDITGFMGNRYKNLSFGSLASSVQFIPLEVNENSVFRSSAIFYGNKIKVTDSLVFITDRNNVLSFDMEGRFLHRFGNQGRGPGEYITADNLVVCKDRGYLMIHCMAGRKLVAFSFDGTFREEISIGIVPNIVTMYNNKFICISARGWREYDSDSYALTVLNSDGSLFRRFINRSDDIFEADPPASYCVNFVGDELHIFEHDYSVLWVMNKDFEIVKAHPVKYYDGKYQDKIWSSSAHSLYSNNLPEVLKIHFLLETERYMLFQVINRGQNQRIIYDRHTGEGYRWEGEKDEYSQGVFFWPGHPDTDGALSLLIHGRDLKRYLEREERSFDPGETLALRMEEPGFENVPVIMILKLK